MSFVAGKHVLYFALLPPSGAAAAALAIAETARRRHGLKAKPVAAARLHVSLNGVGAFKRPPGPVIDKAADAAKSVAARPFTVEFNRLASWTPGATGRPLVLWGEEGVIGVNGLYSAIHKALVRFGMAPRREPRFEPHMTLLRDPGEAPDEVVPPLNWRVTEFVLVHAVHGEGRYEVAARFPLSG
ncbi:2'-5' RNA ligase family protein [Phenylobacterium sp.]|uniref:2'-5' RNA ligase family protein n=1 Tax=Phenylobacterium sp. TaxID=1871053 RepID=UPI00301BBBA5